MQSHVEVLGIAEWALVVAVDGERSGSLNNLHNQHRDKRVGVGMGCGGDGQCIIIVIDYLHNQHTDKRVGEGKGLLKEGVGCVCVGGGGVFLVTCYSGRSVGE